jgi:hypothetical protein
MDIAGQIAMASAQPLPFPKTYTLQGKSPTGQASKPLSEINTPQEGTSSIRKGSSSTSSLSILSKLFSRKKKKNNNNKVKLTSTSEVSVGSYNTID